jgi:cardiolipin synthase
MPDGASRHSEPSGFSERKAWFTVPNALTILRLVAIIPFSYLAVNGRDTEALILFIVAGLTDALDGTIARQFDQASTVGRLLDPLADKVFTGVAFVVLSAFRSGFSSIPRWVMVAVLARDVVILGGSLIVYSTKCNSGFKPSVFGKLNTLLEICIVVGFLGTAKFPLIGEILPGLYIILLISLLISGGDYVRAGWRMMRMPAAPSGR